MVRLGDPLPFPRRRLRDLPGQEMGLAPVYRIFIVLIGYNIFVYGYMNPCYDIKIVVAFILVVTATSAVFLRKQVYAPYFNTRLRWWEVPKRYPMALNTRVFTENGDVHDGDLLDISRAGCFIRLATPLRKGDEVWMVTKYRELQINCLGTVVRKAVVGETTRGYGIIFQAMTRDTRATMNQLIRTLQRLGIEDRGEPISTSRLLGTLNH